MISFFWVVFWHRTRFLRGKREAWCSRYLPLWLTFFPSQNRRRNMCLLIFCDYILSTGDSYYFCRWFTNDFPSEWYGQQWCHHSLVHWGLWERLVHIWKRRTGWWFNSLATGQLILFCWQLQPLKIRLDTFGQICDHCCSVFHNAFVAFTVAMLILTVDWWNGKLMAFTVYRWNGNCLSRIYKRELWSCVQVSRLNKTLQARDRVSLVLSSCTWW